MTIWAICKNRLLPNSPNQTSANNSPKCLTPFFFKCTHDVIQVEQKSNAYCKFRYTFFKWRHDSNWPHKKTILIKMQIPTVFVLTREWFFGWWAFYWRESLLPFGRTGRTRTANRRMLPSLVRADLARRMLPSLVRADLASIVPCFTDRLLFSIFGA